MNIGFFTENPFYGKLNRNQGGRTDANWLIGLNATNIGFNFEPKENYDVGIIIVPKKNPVKAFEYIAKWSHVCKKWCYLQEGPSNLYQDWPIEVQIGYLNMLTQITIIFCHNEQDKLYFEGLIPNQRVEVFPSLLIEDSIPEIPYEDRLHSMISGNMVSWYGGMDSFIVGRNLGDLVYCPSMGRKQDGEERIEGLVHLPYLNWQEWFLELNKRKYGVNLMRTFAAGSFSLACARLGIPCLGWGRNDEKSPEGIDAQRLLFPELTVPTGNMKEAIRVAKHLKENELFYDHCSNYAKVKYNEIYSEEIFITKIMEILK